MTFSYQQEIAQDYPHLLYQEAQFFQYLITPWSQAQQFTADYQQNQQYFGSLQRALVVYVQNVTSSDAYTQATTPETMRALLTAANIDSVILGAVGQIWP